VNITYKLISTIVLIRYQKSRNCHTAVAYNNNPFIYIIQDDLHQPAVQYPIVHIWIRTEHTRVLLSNVIYAISIQFLLFWHAPLGVYSTICTHQSPQRTVLSQVDCFVQCEVVGSQISLDGVQPRDMGTPLWSLPVLWWGSQ